MGALQGALAQKFDNFPRGARFISPAALVFSEKTTTQASNLPTDRILSEQEVLAHWQSVEGGVVSVVRDLFGVPGVMVEQFRPQVEPMLALASDKSYRTLRAKRPAVLTCSQVL